MTPRLQSAHDRGASAPVRRGRIALLLATLLQVSTAGAGPLDPDDKAKVAVIDAKAASALGTAVDVRSEADALPIAGSRQALRLDQLGWFHRARRRLDIERMLLASCAVPCAKKPLPPADPRSHESCWDCMNPRLMITRANGGLLDDVFERVEVDRRQLGHAGIEFDTAAVDELMELAQTALADGDGEEAFTHACAAYGVMSCERSGAKGEAETRAGRSR